MLIRENERILLGQDEKNKQDEKQKENENDVDHGPEDIGYCPKID